MIEVANEKCNAMDLQLPHLIIRQEDVSKLDTHKYDLVFCGQVLQNLSRDPAEAEIRRKQFYQEILRVLKPGTDWMCLEGSRSSSILHCSIAD